jgi:hypothetical protein
VTTADIPEPVRDLLAAVLEAVTLPHDALEHARRMQTRADWVRATLEGALEEDARQEDPLGFGWHAGFLRGRIAAEDAGAAARAEKRAGRGEGQ